MSLLSYGPLWLLVTLLLAALVVYRYERPKHYSESHQERQARANTRPHGGVDPW